MPPGFQSTVWEPCTLAKDDKGCRQGSGNRKIGVTIKALFREKKSVDPEMLPGSITVKIFENFQNFA